MFWNPNLDAVGGWLVLRTSNRVRAFTYFNEEILPDLRDAYKKLILQKLDEQGLEYYYSMISRLLVEGKQRFVENILGINLSTSTEEEMHLIDCEWVFVEVKLREALQFLRKH